MADSIIYYKHLGKDCDWECDVVDWKNSASRVSDKTHVSDMESPWANQAHRHSKSIHLWCSLLCGSWHCLARRYASEWSTQYWRDTSDKAWTASWSREGFCAHRFWIHSQAWAQDHGMIMIMIMMSIIVLELLAMLFCTRKWLQFIFTVLFTFFLENKMTTFCFFEVLSYAASCPIDNILEGYDVSKIISEISLIFYLTDWK